MTSVSPSRRGGKRAGAGRKKSGHQSTSGVSGFDLKAALSAPAPEDIESVAQLHAREAIASLVKQLMHGASESARVNAANALLDRGYGKPSVDAGGMQMSLFGAGVSVAAASDIRDEARKYANLAIEVLRKIATSGESESARVSAARSLLDRGVGTVAQAKVVDGGLGKPLGKKEEASLAARNAGAGRYATPAPPPTVN